MKSCWTIVRDNFSSLLWEAIQCHIAFLDESGSLVLSLYCSIWYCIWAMIAYAPFEVFLGFVEFFQILAINEVSANVRAKILNITLLGLILLHRGQL